MRGQAEEDPDGVKGIVGGQRHPRFLMQMPDRDARVGVCALLQEKM